MSYCLPPPPLAECCEQDLLLTWLKIVEEDLKIHRFEKHTKPQRAEEFKIQFEF